jgi:hypothetical protein
MIAVQMEELEPWFCSCRHFGSDALARAAYLRLSGSDPSGELNIGVYRHGRIGLDHGAVLVSVVGMDADKVERAEEILGGEETELHPSTWLQLIKRRVEVVLKLKEEEKLPGRHEIEHKRPMKLP